MPRHDGNGRNLKAVLTYILNRTVTDNDICEAIKLSRNSYYARRRLADDYPNAEECRLVAEHFDLNAIELMVLFGLVEAEAVQRYAERYLAAQMANSNGRPITPTVMKIATDAANSAPAI